MKKYLIILISLLMLLALMACSEQKGNLVTSGEPEQSTYEDNSENRNLNNTEPLVNDTKLTDIIYNENDSSKNLLLRFLNDELPIVNYKGASDKLFYSDISDPNIKLEESEFFIVDMDGDGKDEYGFFIHPMLEIIKYDDEKEQFELWLSVKSQQRPIGKGEMYAIITGQPIIYEYYKYDADANLLESQYYTIGEEVNKENNTSSTIYRVNGINVTEEEWNNQTKQFFNLKELAPNPIGYEQLYE